MDSASNASGSDCPPRGGGSPGDSVTEGKLRELQAIFEEADTDGEGGLSMEEFRVAMRLTMGDHVTDHELDMLFMKVDTNCDGTVDWDEYLNYMLLESMEKDSMKILAKQPFAKNVTHCKGDHRDSIVRILFMPCMLRGAAVNGSYVSICQEGTVCLWDQNMKLRSTYHVHEILGVPNADVWVTDAAMVNNEHILLITTTSCQVLFFTFTKFRFETLCHMTNLDSSVSCISVCREDDIEEDPPTHKTYILWGDMKGAVSVLVMSVPFLETRLAPHSGADNETHVSKVTFPEVLQGLVDHVKGYKFAGVHGDSVQQVAFIPKLHSVLSCSKDSNASLHLGDLDKKVLNNYFAVPKGINSFDYCPLSNTIVTGGYDSIIRVWNPYVPGQPVMFLKSHRYPILHVMFNSAKELVLSIDLNKEIRVHDLSAQICLQTFYRKKSAALGPRPAAAALFNPYKGALVVGTTTMIYIRDNSEGGNTNELMSHPCPATIVLYNPLFQQVVSTCEDGIIIVWKFATGEKVMQFRPDQVSCDERARSEVYAMVFDPTYRRLVTAAKGGIVKIWNFNNGCCVRELPVFDEALDICDLVVARQRIFTAGWNRRITVYMDSYEDEGVYWLRPSHEEDIVSLDTYTGILASGSYNGVIFLWSLDTNHLTGVLTLDGRTLRDFITAPADCKGKDTDQTVKEVSIKPNSKKLKEKRSSAGDKPLIHIPSCCKVVPLDTRLEQMLFLRARENTVGTATLITSYASGIIRAWSVRSSEGMLGSFVGTHLNRETAILTIASDPDNVFLITGDSLGYIKVWDIRSYHNPNWEYTPEAEVNYRAFPFYLWRKKVEVMKLNTSWLKSYATDSSFPPLLTAFRGHLKAVTAVDYAKFCDQKFILSSSLDCSIRLWMINGEFMAVYGQSQLFSPVMQICEQVNRMQIGDLTVDRGRYQEQKSTVPSDIRRCGSATTLHVVNGNRWSYWFRVKCIIIGFTCFGVRANSAMSHSPDARSISSSVMVEEKANTYRSSILGKAYKCQLRHRPLPILPPVREINNKLCVYRCLPYSDLEPIEHVSTPSVITEMRQRPLHHDNTHEHAGKAKGKATGQRKPGHRRESLNVHPTSLR